MARYAPPVVETSGSVIARVASNVMAGACFVAGTLIHTPHGPRPIETLRAGDQVLSQPELTGERAYRRIVETVAFDDKVIWEIEYEDETGRRERQRATGNHPFWIAEAGWTALELVEEGDRLELANGAEAIVTCVHDTGTRASVFNFEVDGFHTYYIGELGAWVHNTNCGQHAANVTETTIQRAVRLGKEGERAAGVVGTKSGAVINGRMRIPERLTGNEVG